MIGGSILLLYTMSKIKFYKNEKTRRIAKFTFFGVAGIFIAFLIVFGVYSLTFSKKIYAKQYIGDMDFSGKSKSEAFSLLDKRSKDLLNSKIELKYLTENGDSKIYTIIPSEINLQFDSQKTADNLWREGRKDNTLVSIWEQLKSMFVKTTHPMIYSANSQAISLKIKSIADEVDVPEQDFSISYQNESFDLVTERQEGKRIDQVAIRLNIEDSIENLKNNQIEFKAKIFKPQVDLQKAKAAVDKANRALQPETLTFSYDNQQFKADKDTLAGFIKSKTDGDDLKIIFNDDRIKAFVESIAKNINVEPKNAKLAVSSGKAVVFEASTVGRNLYKDETKIDIENNLSARIQSETDSDLATILLKVETKDPEITEQKINSMGITELVGTAETNFTNSPANRVHNIQIGAAALNGVLLKPEETFSTLAHLGAIDASSGYLEELVIKENKTVPEFGGGLCQVSSTLFRAALNAGLKIVERQNHKYRVSYYEPPVGMDATIYDPSPDFRFINNYGSYLLIQSRVVGTKISFDIYGTKDGRVAEVGVPAITDVVEPAPPLYTETETLAPGVKKKVDSAHQGATATFHYKVSRGSEILQERDFVSKYVPWQEKWLVGKGTPPPAPSPEPAPAPPPAPAPEPAPAPAAETTVPAT